MGVTHFERRDRQKREPEVCQVCNDPIKATPRMLAGPKRRVWMEKWVAHLRDHILGSPSLIEESIRTAFIVAEESERNR